MCPVTRQPADDLGHCWNEPLWSTASQQGLIPVLISLSIDLGSYLQFEEVAARAKEIVLAYDECVELIRERSKKQEMNDFELVVDSIVLKPGRREVLLRVLFPDKGGFQVKLDVDNALVHWVKNYF